MKFTLSLFALLLIPHVAEAKADPRCLPPAKDEPVVYMNEFHWGQSREDQKKNFEWLYNTGKRLFGRAYFNETTNSYEVSQPHGIVKLDPKFIASVTRHLEIALDRQYAENIFFPDMGHSHFYVPEKEWPAIANEPVRSKVYEKLFALRSLKILYHTAEQLQVKPGEHSEGPFPQDPVLLWRYFSRNVFGDNDGGENVAILFNGPTGYNSISDVAGYHLYSAGFYVSASKDGCFSYQHDGKKYYFDLSIDEMPYDNSKGDDQGAVNKTLLPLMLIREPASKRK
ncbi:MAG: hypothetical protein ACXWQO_08110 [Bdellovibrionota bacterium]